MVTPYWVLSLCAVWKCGKPAVCIVLLLHRKFLPDQLFTCIQSFAAVMRSWLLMVIEQSSHWQHTNGQMGPHPVTYHAVAHLDWVQFATAIQIYFHTILFDYNRWAEAFSWLHSKWHVQCGQYTLWQYTLWIVVLLAMANWHRHDLSSNMWSLLLMRKCASIISSILQWLG